MARCLCAFRWGVLAAGLVAGACATTAPTVKSGTSAVRDGAGLVVGRFGVKNRSPVNALVFKVRARDVNTGKEWRLPIDTDGKAEDGNSAPFFAELPAGRYRITSWVLTAVAHEISGEDAGVEFDVGRGEVACIGAIYMAAQQQYHNVGLQKFFTGGARVIDECEDLGASLKTKAPGLATATTARLAAPAPRRR